MRKAWLVIWAFFILTLLIVGPIGYALYLNRNDLRAVGHVWVMMFMVLPYLLVFAFVVTVAIGLAMALKQLFRYEFNDIGPVGTIGQRFLTTKTYAPLQVVTPKAAGGTVLAEIQPDIPRLAELIQRNDLVKIEEGKPVMFQGFRLDSTPRYGEWPGVIGVAGMQNVGKSVTIETLAIIALMQQAHVVVCDTHYTKARSLYKKLQCLEGYVTFARNEQEVLQEAENFSQELIRRKAGSDPYPYVFILDEAASVIRSSIGEQITTIIEEASQEGHGYYLHLVLAIHDFSKEGVGDARVRDFLNWIYCHRMQSGQSKFIAAFNTPKNKKAIAALPVGHTVTKDEINEVEYLIMPNADSKDAFVALARLRELGARQAPKEIEAPEPMQFTNEPSEFNHAEPVRFIPPLPDLPSKSISEPVRFSSLADERLDKVRKMWGKFSQTDIIETVWNVTKGGSQAYQEARTEFLEIVEQLKREAVAS